MQFPTVLTLLTTLLATSVSALPTETSELGTIEVGAAKYHGEIAVRAILENRGILPGCTSCTPGKGQCAGKNGCYSCNNGPYLCQDPSKGRCCSTDGSFDIDN